MGDKAEILTSITNLSLLSQRLSKQGTSTSLTKSVPQLKYLLEKDNLKFHYPSETVERCSLQLAQKGTKLPTTQQLLKGSNRQGNIPDLNKSHSSCYFYVPELTLGNMRELISKAHQYSVFNNIQTVMCDFQDISMDSFHLEDIGSFKGSSSFRNENKFRQYNQIVSSFVSSGLAQQTVSATQLLRLFHSSSKNQLWHLIIRLFQDVDVEASSLEIQKQLIINSSLLLEEDYSKRIPSDSSSFESFVKGEAIDRIGYGKNYIYYNKNGRPVWAMVYILLRAGRIENIKRLGNEVEYSKLFSDFTSYLNGEVKHYQMESANKDMFLEAIYSIFNRKAECSFEILNDQRDYIWFSLKTITISNFSPSSFSLSNLQEEIIKRYEANPTQQNYTNLIYVLAFQKLSEHNPYFDLDDSTHLLLFLHLIFTGEDTDLLTQSDREEFYQKMANYSQQLIGKNIELALDYILITVDRNHNPTSSVLSVISEILIYNQSVERFFGEPPSINTPIQERVKAALEPTKEQYESFIYNTINKYASTSKNYIYPSKVFEYVLGNTNKSIQYLLDVLAKDILGDSYFNQGEIQEITKLIERIQENKKLAGAYTRLLEFIQLTKYIKNIIVLDQPVQDNIFKSKYSPLGLDGSPSTRQILLDLSNSEYLSIYGVFLYYFLKATEKFYSYKPQKVKEFIEAVKNIRSHFNKVRENGVVMNGGSVFKEKMNQIEKELDYIKA